MMVPFALPGLGRFLLLVLLESLWNRVVAFGIFSFLETHGWLQTPITTQTRISGMRTYIHQLLSCRAHETVVSSPLYSESSRWAWWSCIWWHGQGWRLGRARMTTRTGWIKVHWVRTTGYVCRTRYSAWNGTHLQARKNIFNYTSNTWCY